MSGQSTAARPELPPVEYRDLATFGFPGYRVGSDGSVWSLKHRWGPRPRPKQLRPLPCRTGHQAVWLSIGARAVRRHIHRLVLEAFVGPRLLGQECCHEDGDPTNNRLSNLRWDTSKANSADAQKHGTRVMGETHGLAKLSVASVRETRRLYANGGYTLKSLALRFGVVETCVSKIVRGQTWKHCKEPIE